MQTVRVYFVPEEFAPPTLLFSDNYEVGDLLASYSTSDTTLYILNSASPSNNPNNFNVKFQILILNS